MEVSYSILRDVPPAPGPVNIGELQQVREHHMPTPLVQFSPLCEVRRRANEVSQQHPNLKEEAHFVFVDEVDRRLRLLHLAQSPLTLS